MPTIRDDFESGDPDFIRQFLPILWLLASFWYRAEVRGLEKWLCLDRMFRLKVLPISLALPWGLNIGDECARHGGNSDNFVGSRNDGIA